MILDIRDLLIAAFRLATTFELSVIWLHLKEFI